MAYSDKVIDHYEHPRNVGTLDKADENVGTGLVGAPAHRLRTQTKSQLLKAAIQRASEILPVGAADLPALADIEQRSSGTIPATKPATKNPASPPGLVASFALRRSDRLQIASRLLATLGDDLVADLLAFVERAHACALHGADVHEHILRAIVRLNEAEAFLRIEELHSSGSHLISFHAR